jgi:predicted DNA-binding protein
MKILTLRLPMELYDKLWQIHSDTRNNINSIIIELIEKGLEK